MTSNPSPTRLELTRSHVTAADPVRDAEGATLIQESSDSSTLPESSAGDFQLSYYFAQQAAVEDSSGSDEDLHGARCPRFGRFVLLELLGRGGMGEVYRALHVRLRKQAAIKLLPLERAADPQARERFQREIRVISQLEHPNIVRLENAGEIDGLPYLVMEYIPGLDLEQLVGRLGPLPVADACQLVGQAAIGLSHIHQQGLVHRDLKPGNLILSTEGALKIADLGLARLVEGESQITAEGTLLGDPHYMSPEQIDGSGLVDIRSDIYSLGCTLFTLLTGRPPFAETGSDPTKVLAAHLYQPFPAATNQRDDIPSGLQKILNRMTVRQPAKRYASPGEVAAALAPHAQGCDPVGLLRRADIVPREAARPAGGTVDSAEYLRSSGEFRAPRRSHRWLISVACLVTGVLVTVSALAAFRLLNRTPDEKAIADPVTPDPAGAAAESYVNTAVTVPADWHDAGKDGIDEHAAGARESSSVLSAVEPRRDAFHADVTTDSEGIIFSAAERGILQLPVQPSEEYQLDMVVERLEGEHSFGIGVNAGSGRLLAVVDHALDGSAKMGLLHSENGTQLLDQHLVQLLPVGRQVRIQVDVSPTRVCLKVEDPLALETGAAAESEWLSSCWDRQPAEPELSRIDAYYPGVLFLHAYKSSFRLHDLTITSADGRPATLLFDPAERTARRLAERILWRGGRVQLLTASGETWMDRLESLPEEIWIVGVEPRDSSPSLRLDDDDLREIAELAVGLKKFDLRSSDVTNDGLAFIDGLPSLEWLALSGKNLTGAGLSRIRSLPALKQIYLIGMSVGDDDVQALTRFPTLTHLCFSKSDVTDTGIMELAGAFPDLHHLCLNYTDVNGDCLPSLASFPKLKELNLVQTHVNDDDVPALAALPALESVDLTQTQVTKEGVAPLREQLAQRRGVSP